MPYEPDPRLLDAVLDRLLPVAGGEAMRAYVRERAGLQPDLYQAGLLLLESKGFAALDPQAQDRILAGLEDHPSVARMVQHAVEGYYTSAAGLADVGFRVTA